MTILSGPVAIIENGMVAEVRYLGPDPVQVKDNVLPLVYDVTNTATGPNTVVTDAAPVIGATEVTIARNVRDRTAQDDDDEIAAHAASLALRPEVKALKLVLAGLLFLTNDVRARHGQGAITANAFLTNLNSIADQIPDAAFLAKIKELIRP